MSSDYRIAGYLLPSILVLWLVACFVGAEHRVQAGAADASTSLAFDIPPYTGQSYTDSVPATLDLAEMARLSLNALTQPVDPDQDYSLYFVASWNQNPPVLRHETGSDDCLGKFIGPQVLNRLISGSDQNLDHEHHILERAYL